ncbi:MAG: hypothetical protein AAGJ18_07360 [Bacteroidota bacterium]
MKDEKEKWMDAVFQSMQGSQRARPRPDLLAKIENQIAVSKVKIVSLRQWKYAVAAAAIILLMNITALRHFHQPQPMNEEKVVALETYSQSLTSSFQIYE